MLRDTLREKCPNTEFFWSVFSRIWTEYEVNPRIESKYRKIRTRKTPYLDTFCAVVCNEIVTEKAVIYLE